MVDHKEQKVIYFEKKTGRSYDVYRRSDGKWETIKNGFSWPAVFFSMIWAWVKGMDGVGFALLGLNFLLYILNAVIAGLLGQYGILGVACIVFYFLFLLGVIFWVGFSGNEWRKKSMDKRGFEIVARSIYASSRDATIRAVSSNEGRV
jgi:hypothetical protein